MKKALFLFVPLFLSSVVFGQDTEPQRPSGPKDASFAKFDDIIYNFGTLEYGAEAVCEFTFVNTAEKSLVIKNVERSCGCTTPSYSKEPVEPGKSGTIKASYDTHRVGYFKKTITVTFTDGSKRRLTITGTVKPQTTENQ